MRFVRFVLMGVLGACSTEEATPGGGGGAGGGAIVGSGGGTTGAAGGEGGAGGLAFEEKTCPLVVTSSATTVDLRAGASVLGTCGHYEAAGDRAGTSLPDDPAAYPIRVLLPAVEAADPACEATCNSVVGDPVTTFGIALSIENNSDRVRDAGLYPIFVAPSPWLVVSGGCGEACPYPCLGGYQEFGEPLACVGPTYVSGFGFSTGAVDVPEMEAFIDLSPLPP